MGISKDTLVTTSKSRKTFLGPKKAPAGAIGYNEKWHLTVYNEKRAHSGIDYLIPSELEEQIRIDPSTANRFVLEL